MNDDVVVIGGGLAGSIAALAAARARPELSVRLITREETTLIQASGLVDVLGYTPDGDGPIVDPFVAIPRLPQSHPYSTVGVEGVRDALALFDDVVGDAYGGDGTDRNALVPTCWGRLKPTARYFSSATAGLATERTAATLVGFGQLSGFDAPFVADRLSDQLPYRVDGITVDFPRDLSRNPTSVDDTPLQCARALDSNEEDDDGETVLDGVVDNLEIYLGRKARAGFPAVLGLETHEEIHDRLADRLGIRVFEVPMGPPSVPGLRLQSLLGEALSEAGVRVTTGTSVVGFEASDGRIEQLRLDGQASVSEASQFILATGGVAGGGVDSDRETVSEPIFDCHVEAPQDRSEWADTDPFGDHAFARFGVTVDEDMVPLTARGQREFANLRAAGAVLGGYDFASEHSGSGVSIATGYAAGRRAAEKV